jgi:hypothetical protein
MRYLLEPVSGMVRIALNRSENIQNDPKMDIQVEFDRIVLGLDDWQYRDICKLLEFFHNYTKSVPYLQYRPIKSPRESPTHWWAYAYKGHLAQRRRQFKSWKYIKQFTQARNTYIELDIKRRMQSLDTAFKLV